MEYIIWCDESIKKGEFYSNFYGGALVRSVDLEEVIEKLETKKQELHLFNEVKWNKITWAYKDKYVDLLDEFFDLVEKQLVKIRIMFTNNSIVPTCLTKQQLDNEFFLLYYQFVKHAFGITTCMHAENTKLRINFDKIPDSKEKACEFKDYIFKLNMIFNKKNVYLERDGISEVDSHNHVVLQCLDIVLGSMSFRLNKKHLDKPEGERIRAKKTRAKEYVYKFINKRIQGLYLKYTFNIGISTGFDIPPYEVHTARWQMPYRHWRFMPNNREYVSTKKK
jgi:hypothetical protein